MQRIDNVQEKLRLCCSEVPLILEDPATRPRMLNAAVWAVLAMERENKRLLFEAIDAELRRG